MTDLPSGPSPVPPSRRRRWPLIALAAAVVAGAAVVGALVLPDEDDDEKRPSPVTSELPDALDGATDADTAELADLLESGRQSSYHARYTLSDATGEAPAVELEVWRKGDRLRQDTRTDVGGQAVETSSFALRSEVVLCSRSGGAWSCAESQPTGSEQDGILGSVQDQLAGSDVIPRDDELDGLEVRCFAFSGPEGDGDLCVTPTGVPARVDFNGVSIELVAVDDDVPSTVFAPPAEAVQAAG